MADIISQNQVIHEGDETFTNMDELLASVYGLLNSRNIGNTPEDPSVAILIRTTGKFTNEEAEMSVVVYENFTEEQIATHMTEQSLAPADQVVDEAPVVVKGKFGGKHSA
jgi:hypothetical protein